MPDTSVVNADGLGGHFVQLCLSTRAVLCASGIVHLFGESVGSEENSRKRSNIAAMPGDDFCAKVRAAGIHVLASLATKNGGCARPFNHFDWGGNYYLRHGKLIPVEASPSPSVRSEPP
jgi:hypothetical protein